MLKNAVLELQSIDKAYNWRKVLSNLSLRLFAGECIVLTGKNGCGKSTLLKVAAGLSLPDNGNVVSDPGSSTQFVPDRFLPIQMTGRLFSVSWRALTAKRRGADSAIPYGRLD